MSSKTDAGGYEGPFIRWLTQDWAVNRSRPDSQVILLCFRLAQWARFRPTVVKWPIACGYWLITSLIIGIEIPWSAVVGPRLRLYHPHNIVLNPAAVLGADCHLRHGVTVGNTVDREGRELGVARVGSRVDLGAGCVVIGDVVIGDDARVGALAVVTRSVPKGAVVVGNPARVIRIDDLEEREA